MKIVEVTIYNNDYYDMHDLSAKDYIKFFQEKLNEIPDEFKDSANIKYEAFDSYGDPTINVRMYYFRPQTEGELQAEVAEEARLSEYYRAAKLASFEHLKRELGL